MADETTPHSDHVSGDKIARDKIDTQINHYHNHYYGADKQREHDLHLLYLRSLFQKSWTEVGLAEFGTDDRRPHLCELYVRLPVDLQLTVRTLKDQIIDWGVGGEGREEALVREQKSGATQSMRPRQSEAHKLSEAQLQHIVDGLQRQILAEAAASERDQEQEPKPRNRTVTLNAEDIASLNDALVVLGAPGSGKSSFARHYALRMAGDLLGTFGEAAEYASATLDDLWNGKCVPVTPIYIELRDLIATEGIFPELPKDDKKPAALPREDALWQYLRKSANGLPENLQGLLEPLQKMLTTGEALVILDGLDEVDRAFDPRRLDQIQAFVRYLRKAYRARVLVTSRPYAYNLRTQAGEQPWRLEGFGVANLIDLESDTQRALAEAAFRPAAGNLAESLAQQFMVEVARVPDSLRANPLFLTMLAGLWWQHKDSRAEGERLPRTEADLYRQALEHLLTRWTRKPGNTQSVEEELGLSTGQLRLALQIVALQTQRESEVGEDTTLFHKERLQLALLRVDEDGRPKPSIDYLQTKAGVLLSPHTDHFRFAHRSFQEHLAACELLGEQEQPLLTAPLAELVIESPALWRNVLQHACDELIRRDEREKLWELIRALTDPWLANAEQDKMVQPALLALQNAERQNLLKSARDRRDPHRADLEDLQKIALALIVDLRLVAKERASAGRCLAKLGDPRQGVMDVRAMEWLPVNAGPFQMGSTDTDTLAYFYEKPLHTQHIAQAYKIARFPITNAQYRQFVDAGGYDNAVYWPQAGEYWQPKLGSKGRYDDDYRKAPAYAADELDRFGLDNQPVVQISWHEAVAFTHWLTAFLRHEKLIGAHEEIRLPSESEWEKACRGDSDARVTPWDGPPDPERSNYDASGINATSGVGCFPNGITGCEGEDMIGNVWEWTTTKWVDSYANYAEAADNSIDASEDSRVLRGGSWIDGHGGARCASRSSYLPSGVLQDFGLRCVLSPSSLKSSSPSG